MIRRALLLSLVLGVSSAACSGSPPPAPAASASVDLGDTTWGGDNIFDRGGAPSGGSCGLRSSKTFNRDGYVDYVSRCPNEAQDRRYRGRDDNSTWSQDGQTVRISTNNGYSVCEGIVEDAERMTGTCSNAKGESYRFEYTRER